MAGPDPQSQREFAHSVVQRLHEAGHAAYWAGGCVRDQLLGRQPKDYDVATDARPEQIRELFGRRRTLPIGAAFGVITVLGPRGAGQIEVATFRQDAAYSDGRHPDSVTFSTAQEDAQRRDFTINGMFFDPLAQQVIDFVGGQEDLARGVVRAIGDASTRFAEDKLRMLRAVRFATALKFELDEATTAAIRQMAAELQVVSAERIAAEMRRMLVDPQRSRAVRLLRQTGLLAVVLRDLALPDEAVWEKTLSVLDQLQEPSFSLAAAALLADWVDAEQAEKIARSWRLSNDESRRITWLIAHRDYMDGSRRYPWSVLQPALVHPGAAELVAVGEARAAVGLIDPGFVRTCRQQLSWPAEKLDPAPLLSGDDLTAHGVAPGRRYRKLLQWVRDAQLLGEVKTREEALALVDQLNNQAAD